MRCVFAILFILVAYSSHAQKQLVFLHHESVIARFTEGDYFTCVLKNGQKKKGNILSLGEFSMITSAADTIHFLSIRKIKNPKAKKFKISGVPALMIFSGLGYIAFDQINSIAGPTSGRFDGAYVTALSLVSAGTAIVLFRPKFIKVKRGMVMRSVDYRSPYFSSN
ncbi:MAG: hypothetical protein ACKOEV_10825 [Cytophagales bacterium]